VVVVGVGVDVGVAVVLLEVVGVGIVVVALVSGVVEVVSASVVELDEVAAASGWEVVVEVCSGVVEDVIPPGVVEVVDELEVAGSGWGVVVEVCSGSEVLVEVCARVVEELEVGATISTVMSLYMNSTPALASWVLIAFSVSESRKTCA
jgi:hypothetical protein